MTPLVRYVVKKYLGRTRVKSIIKLCGYTLLIYTEGCAMPSIPSFVRVEEEITDFQRVHGSFLHFHCIPGYSMTEGGVSEIKCWFGEWTFPPPTCVPGKKMSSI